MDNAWTALGQRWPPAGVGFGRCTLIACTTLDGVRKHACFTSNGSYCQVACWVGQPPAHPRRRTSGAPLAPRPPPPPPSPAGGWAGWPGANLKLDLSLTESVRLRSLLKISRGPHLCLGGGLWAAGRSLSWTGRSPPWRAVPPAPTRAFVKF